MGKGMKAGKKSKGAGGSLNQRQAQLAQMQAMQEQMESLQSEIDKMESSASSGGGAVTVTVNGARQLTQVEIKAEVVDPDDVEMLQDLILAATNEALRQIEEISANEMSKLTGGLGIPGF